MMKLENLVSYSIGGMVFTVHLKGRTSVIKGHNWAHLSKILTIDIKWYHIIPVLHKYIRIEYR